MTKKNLLLRVKRLRLDRYAHCFVRKQRKVLLKSHSPSKKSDLLKLIHLDVYGPLYFVTFIDDCSRKVYVYA